MPPPCPVNGSTAGVGCVACVTCSGVCLLTQPDCGPLGQAGSSSTTSVRVAKEPGRDDRSFNVSFKRLFFLQNFATVWRVAQVETAVSCRLGTHMTQRKQGCKQTLSLPCSHSLLVQRSDNSLCKMAAGHGSFWEPRWAGITSQALQPALTSLLEYSRGFCYSSAAPVCWLVCICRECKSGEFRQVQHEGRQHKLTSPWSQSVPPGARVNAISLLVPERSAPACKATTGAQRCSAPSQASSVAQ